MSRPRHARALLFATASVIACILQASCGDPTHLYLGRYYVEGRDCLGTTSTLDVIRGDEPGTCSPICFAQKIDGGRSLYVSSMCGPYPFDFDTSGTDPACPAALAAFTRNDTCFEDGGSTAPVDAGTRETGTRDASDD